MAAETGAIEIAIRALTGLAENISCGCMPCHGQCWDKDSLREEISSRCDLARDALKAIGASPAQTIRCDEPSDIFTRITRDMARSA